ncbi:DUF362 domain-containing protein [Candidatus Microgenomates bacterium]|nr:DUF362 domain-containing protein [Candidatus Microgenomates bacterium]
MPITKTSLVSCVKVKVGKDPKLVFKAVAQAMKLAHWEKYVKGRNIVLKVNVVWDKLYPSCTTTPMVIEGVIKTLLQKFPNAKITIVDTDTPGIMHAHYSFRNLGINYMAKKYGIKTVNLTNTSFRTVNLNGEKLKKFKVSKVLLDADTIITIPVMKTHSISTVSLSLKNQWGCIHDLRHNFHLYLAKAIGDVNNFYKKKVSFVVMDGLFGMEGKGPKNGKPVKVGFIFASPDRVALDTLVAQSMGFDPQKVDHITHCQNLKIGTMNYKIVGSKPPKMKFASPHDFQLTFWVEMFLRKLGPFYEKLFFQTNILYPLRLAARVYNDIWYYFIGSKNKDRMMKTDFGQMWQEYLNNAS